MLCKFTAAPTSCSPDSWDKYWGNSLSVFHYILRLHSRFLNNPDIFIWTHSLISDNDVVTSWNLINKSHPIKASTTLSLLDLGHKLIPKFHAELHASHATS